MNKTVLPLLLAFSSVLALSSVLAASSANLQVGKVTRLMTKDLPDVPGKEGMVETVDFAPGEISQPHRRTLSVRCRRSALKTDDDIWKIISWIRLVYCERHPTAC
jgi:hypothetical protein